MWQKHDMYMCLCVVMIIMELWTSSHVIHIIQVLHSSSTNTIYTLNFVCLCHGCKQQRYLPIHVMWRATRCPGTIHWLNGKYTRQTTITVSSTLHTHVMNNETTSILTLHARQQQHFKSKMYLQVRQTGAMLYKNSCAYYSHLPKMWHMFRSDQQWTLFTTVHFNGKHGELYYI